MLIGAHDTSQRVLIIAEAGVNHEGDMSRARALIDAAADAGADAVKFQTYKTDRLLMRQETARIAQRQRFELADAQFVRLAEHCRECQIMFLSTPFDRESLELLVPLVPALKISSLDFTNYQLLAYALETRKPLLLSCGMSDEAMVTRTIGFIRERAGAQFMQEAVALLHCVSSYPVPLGSVNLLSIPYLASRYELEVGYSDHALGNTISVAAVALGARIVEKHFTLDKTMTGVRDHQLSADPAELRQLVHAIRQVEAALGGQGKSIADTERDNLYTMRRGLVATVDLAAGSVLTEENVSLLLPCRGIPSDQYFDILGRSLKRTVKQGEALEVDHVDWN